MGSALHVLAKQGEEVHTGHTAEDAMRAVHAHVVCDSWPRTQIGLPVTLEYVDADFTGFADVGVIDLGQKVTPWW